MLLINYNTTKKVKSLPTYIISDEGIPLYSPKSFELELGEQKIINLNLSFKVPQNKYLFMSIINHPTLKEPLVCPVILPNLYQE